MDLKKCSIALFVNDIEVSKQFYIHTLQQQVDMDFGKNVIFKAGFAIWEISTDHIIPNRLGVDKISDQSINRFELYFETDHLLQIRQALNEKNVKFVHEIFSTYIYVVLILDVYLRRN